MKKTSTSRKIFVFFNTIVLAFIGVASLYPLIYCMLMSLSESKLVMAHTGLVFKPLGLSWAAYKEVFTDPRILTGYENTIIIVVVATVLNMIMTSMAAFFLSRKNVVFSKALMISIVITMYFHGGMIPTFLLMKNIGLYDSLWALIIPGMISAYNMIILRSAFAGVPQSLEESAMIDGAGPWTILWKIILPLSKASLAVICLYYAVTHWNAWFGAQIYLRDPEKYPLQLILRQTLLRTSGESGIDSVGDAEDISATIQYAIIIIATLPVLCVYPFVQRYFTKGVTVGAVKG